MPALGHVVRERVLITDGAERAVQERTALAVQQPGSADCSPECSCRSRSVHDSRSVCRHERVGRVGQLRQARRLVVHVPAVGGLDGGLAVAEHIPGGAEARADVLPVRHVVDCREADRSEEPRPPGPASAPGCTGTVQAVVADAEVQRQLLDRPLILRRRARASASARLIWRVRIRALLDLRSVRVPLMMY